LFEPIPLHDARFEQGGRRIGIVFEQLGRAPPVIGEIEPAVEIAVAALPALADEGPLRFGNGEPGQDRVITDRLLDEGEAELLDRLGRRLDIALDLFQREGIGRAFVPIGLAVDGVEGKAEALDLGLPIGAASKTTRRISGR
jgi:hypothetical protein